MVMTVQYCELIKIIVTNAEKNLDWYLQMLDDAGNDWHPGTLPISDLENAAKTLRALAAEIDNKREAMLRADLRQEKHNAA